MAIRSVGLFFIFFLGTSPACAQSLDGCPPGSERARAIVESYLSDSEWSEERQEAGIAISPSKIRLLTDEQDPEVCQELADGTSNNEWIEHFFYKAGPYYFNLALLRPPNERPNESFGGKQGLLIYDQNFELVGIYML
jgi:hypothetical protein